MFKRGIVSVGGHRRGVKDAKTSRSAPFCVLCVLAVIPCTVLLATACAPASQPTPTASLTSTPTPEPTWTAEPSPEPSRTPLAPTPTPSAAQLGEVEGLVMTDNGQLIIGVNWTSKSRITYLVEGGDIEAVRSFLNETARVTGEIVDRSPWLKEMRVRGVEASTALDRLSRRTGFIKELGVSIYMQGTHLLTDRDGNTICLLSGKQSGLDLDSYILKGQVAVIGVMSKTVEGNAQIMEVQLVEKVE